MFHTGSWIKFWDTVLAYFYSTFWMISILKSENTITLYFIKKIIKILWLWYCWIKKNTVESAERYQSISYLSNEFYVKNKEVVDENFQRNSTLVSQICKHIPSTEWSRKLLKQLLLDHVSRILINWKVSIFIIKHNTGISTNSFTNLLFPNISCKNDLL